MQVHVDDIEAHVARAHLAEDGVEVGTVVIEQAARTVNDARHLADLPLEDAERGGVGQHDARGVGTHRALERREVDIALGVDRDLLDDAAAHGRGRRVRAVRRLGHDDLVAREVAAGAVVGADHRHPRELAVRAGHRAQRHRAHAGDLLEHLLQFEHALQEALPLRLGRARMAREELGQHRVLVAGLGVVFHRARTERVEVRVDGEVELREPGEMAHGVELAHLGQQRRLAAAQRFRHCAADPLGRRASADRRRYLRSRDPARPGVFKDGLLERLVHVVYLMSLWEALCGAAQAARDACSAWPSAPA